MPSTRPCGRPTRLAGALALLTMTTLTLTETTTATGPSVGRGGRRAAPMCFQKVKGQTPSSPVAVQSRLRRPQDARRTHKTDMQAMDAMSTTASPRRYHARLAASSSSSLAGDVADSPAHRAVPVPRPDEPDLYDFPAGVHPTYRPLPWYAQLASISLSVVASAFTATRTWQPLLWMLRASSGRTSASEIVAFVIKSFILSVLSIAVLQDIFLPPSRITMDDIFRKYFLPSKLSRYETIAVPVQSDDGQIDENSEEANLGVHFLKCENRFKSTDDAPTFDAMYLNHGFGASSLSWVPVMPKLSKRVNCRVGLGHDAVGFGFTERPKQDTLFRSASSAAIGMRVLHKHSRVPIEPAPQGAGEDIAEALRDNLEESFVMVPPDESPKPSVALVGHSMGSLSTLDMALSMPEGTRQLVILVAPGVVLDIRASTPPRNPSRIRKVVRSVRGAFARTCVYPTAGYALRRIVGQKGFWRRGLRAAWGDPDRLSESDALRFQWPSVGKGWERGLLRFTAQSPMAIQGPYSNEELVRRVSGRKDTTVYVIHGSKDPVIPSKKVNKFFDQFPDIKRYEMDGLGHDPFEEDVDGFVDLVGSIVDEWKTGQA